MSIKPMDRLLFAQGGQCFFCNQPIAPGEATVEHLVASTNGGTNSAENCVVCCKTLNALLGRMSLKEKIRVVLNQKGAFKCPKGKSKTAPRSKATRNKTPVDRFDVVVTDLHKRGAARPRTLKTLSSTIGALFKKVLSEKEISEIVASLESKRVISIADTKVTYDLPAAGP